MHSSKGRKTVQLTQIYIDTSPHDTQVQLIQVFSDIISHDTHTCIFLVPYLFSCMCNTIHQVSHTLKNKLSTSYFGGPRFQNQVKKQFSWLAFLVLLLVHFKNKTLTRHIIRLLLWVWIAPVPVGANWVHNMMPQKGKLILMPSTAQVQHQLQCGTLEETIQPTVYRLFPVDPEEQITVTVVPK